MQVVGSAGCVSIIDVHEANYEATAPFAAGIRLTILSEDDSFNVTSGTLLLNVCIMLYKFTKSLFFMNRKSVNCVMEE